MFSPLTTEQMLEIVDLQMHEVHQRLKEHGLDVKLSDAARLRLSEIGYDPAFGARPLRRALQKYVESALSINLLSGEFVQGDTILVDLDEGKKEIVFKKIAEESPSEKA